MIMVRPWAITSGIWESSDVDVARPAQIRADHACLGFGWLDWRACRFPGVKQHALCKTDSAEHLRYIMQEHQHVSAILELILLLHGQV